MEKLVHFNSIAITIKAKLMQNMDLGKSLSPGLERTHMALPL